MGSSVSWLVIFQIRIFANYKIKPKLHYEGAADSLRNEYERKQSSIERSAHNKFRDKARNATDDELRHNLQNAIDNIHTVLHQVLQLAVEDNYIRQNISVFIHQKPLL